MHKLSRSVWMVLMAILIIVIGLFLVCAQRQAADAGRGEDLAVDDDQFKQELMQLLDLTEDTTSTAKGKDADVVTEPQDDVLALLQAENEPTPKTAEVHPGTDQGAQKQLETDTQTTNENLGISADMFRKVKGEMEQLERTLESRSTTVDSLRSILDNRNARLQELEKRAVSKPSTPPKSTRKQGSSRRSTAAYSMTGLESSQLKSGYTEARNLFESYQYRQAIEAFNRLLEQRPEDVLADNCQYWIGECYFGLKEYQQAIMEFQKVFAYAQTDKYDDAQLMIGLAYVRSGQRDKAQKEFETFLNNYATSEYAGVARKYYRDI